MNDLTKLMPLCRALDSCGLSAVAAHMVALSLSRHAAETLPRTHIVRAYRDLRSLKHERMPAPPNIEHAAARLLYCALASQGDPGAAGVDLLIERGTTPAAAAEMTCLKKPRKS